MSKKSTNGNNKIVVLTSRQSGNVVIKEKEGRKKNGDPKELRVSQFKGCNGPANAMNYLREKFGV